MTLNEMSADEMSVDKMSADKVTWCRRADKREMALIDTITNGFRKLVDSQPFLPIHHIHVTKTLNRSFQKLNDFSPTFFRLSFILKWNGFLSWGLYYKTFYGRNLRIIIVS
jgi:hypothetical protein